MKDTCMKNTDRTRAQISANYFPVQVKGKNADAAKSVAAIDRMFPGTKAQQRSAILWRMLPFIINKDAQEIKEVAMSVESSAREFSSKYGDQRAARAFLAVADELKFHCFRLKHRPKKALKYLLVRNSAGTNRN